MNHREQLKNKQMIRAFLEERALEARDVLVYFLNVFSLFYDFTANKIGKFVTFLKKQDPVIMALIAIAVFIGVYFN